MNAMMTVMRRELVAYFATPVAYVFILIFLMVQIEFMLLEDMLHTWEVQHLQEQICLMLY